MGVSFRQSFLFFKERLTPIVTWERAIQGGVPHLQPESAFTITDSPLPSSSGWLFLLPHLKALSETFDILTLLPGYRVVNFYIICKQH